MPDAMSSNITASFLDSGRVLANAANAAAIVAGVGCMMTSPMYSRLALTGSILIWFLQSYYALRVAIDGSLFRLLAADPEEAARQLDNFLGRSRTPGRSIDDRARGALTLWRRQIVAISLQLTALILGIFLRIANF